MLITYVLLSKGTYAPLIMLQLLSVFKNSHLFKLWITTFEQQNAYQSPETCSDEVDGRKPQAHFEAGHVRRDVPSDSSITVLEDCVNALYACLRLAPYQNETCMYQAV